MPVAFDAGEFAIGNLRSLLIVIILLALFSYMRKRRGRPVSARSLFRYWPLWVVGLLGLELWVLGVAVGGTGGGLCALAGVLILVAYLVAAIRIRRRRKANRDSAQGSPRG